MVSWYTSAKPEGAINTSFSFSFWLGGRGEGEGGKGGGVGSERVSVSLGPMTRSAPLTKGEEQAELTEATEATQFSLWKSVTGDGGGAS